MRKAIPFYERLGLKLIVHSSDDYARFMCPNGTSTFSIHKVNELPSGDGVYVYFECENLDSHVSKLILEGVQFDEMPNDKSWLWREARLKDLDRNQLILYLAGENRLNPPWRINS